MKNADFERLLKKALQDTPNPGGGLEPMVRRVKAQASQKPRRERIPFRQFLGRQVRYIGWQLWGAQALMLLVFDRMLTELYGERFWDSAVSAARLLFCISTLVAMMSLPLFYRSRKYRMQEIESASYFSSVRLLMAKLSVIGIGDIFLLTGMFLAARIRTSMQAGSLILCLALPFLILSAAYLYMMGHCSGRGFFTGSITLGIGMILFAVVLPGRWLPQFREGMTWGALLFCLGLIGFSAGQLRFLLYRSAYTQLQIS